MKLHQLLAMNQGIHGFALSGARVPRALLEARFREQTWTTACETDTIISNLEEYEEALIWLHQQRMESDFKTVPKAMGSHLLTAPGVVAGVAAIQLTVMDMF